MNNALELSERRLNPLLSLWLKPRATMRQLLHTGFDQWNYSLAAARGAGFAISMPSEQLLPHEWPVYAKVIILVLMGVLFGMALLPMRAWALASTSRHLGGTASYREIRGAIAWSGLIDCWATLVWIALFGIVAILDYFEATFVNSLYEVRGEHGLSAIDLPFLVIAVWHTIVEFKCVAEASRFSVWKAWLAEVFGHGLLAVVLLIPAFFVFGGWAAVTAE